MPVSRQRNVEPEPQSKLTLVNWPSHYGYRVGATVICDRLSVRYEQANPCTSMQKAGADCQNNNFIAARIKSLKGIEPITTGIAGIKAAATTA